MADHGGVSATLQIPSKPESADSASLCMLPRKKTAKAPGSLSESAPP